jgi:hypothetical protein
MKIGRKYKITVWNVYFKKILLYGAETWKCIKGQQRKLQAVEIKFLRGTVGKSR